MNDFADILKSRNFGLILPQEHDIDINRYVARGAVERENYEYRPFRRQVDFWVFSIATALALELEPRGGAVGHWGKTFIYTNQGILDSKIAALLSVIAVARIGHESSEVCDLGRVIEIANRLAGAGCPKVLRDVSRIDLRTTPLDRVLEFAATLHDRVK